MIEGSTERLLLPKTIEKFDAEHGVNLGGLYLSIMEVGGAYAHLFYNLDRLFGSLRTLIITDLDSVNGNNNRAKCSVSEGTHSSNAAINKWFNPDGGHDPTLADLQAKTDDCRKLRASRRLAYQVPHAVGDACGRSFEDAFYVGELRHPFGIDGASG